MVTMSEPGKAANPGRGGVVALAVRVICVVANVATRHSKRQ